MTSSSLDIHCRRKSAHPPLGSNGQFYPQQNQLLSATSSKSCRKSVEGKSNGIFAPVSAGAPRRSPHRPDAVSPRCPAALAYARVGSLAWSGSTSHGGCSAYSFPCLFACLIFTELRCG